MAWLSGWGKRIEITIDKDKVDAALSGFPILLYLSVSSGINNDDVRAIFDELQSDDNRRKIAVTDSGGETECEVEIERWDDGNEVAWLWVKVPTISSTADTTLYIYYDVGHADNPNVGDIGTSAGEAVWDANFEVVCHLRDKTTSTVEDSTINSNDGDKEGVDQPVEEGAKIDKGQHFDGHYISFGDIDDLDGLAKITIEAWVNTDVLTGGGADLRYVVAKETSASQSGWLVRLATAIDRFQFYIGDGSWKGPAQTGVITDGVWYHVVAVYDSSLAVGSQLKIYLQGSPVGSGTGASNNILANDAFVWLGDSAGWPGRSWDGIVDDLRVSVIARTDAWIKASWYSGDDNLVSYGSEATTTTNSTSTSTSSTSTSTSSTSTSLTTSTSTSTSTSSTSTSTTVSATTSTSTTTSVSTSTSSTSTSTSTSSSSTSTSTSSTSTSSTTSLSTSTSSSTSSTSTSTSSTSTSSSTSTTTLAFTGLQII